MLEDIKDSLNWKKIENISKGWSSDNKYLITTKDNEKLLLRVSDIELYDNKKQEFEIIKKFATTGIEMNQPLDFGVCNKGKNVYILLTWIEGYDLEEALKNISSDEQYELGIKAGKILKKIHSMDVEEKDVLTITKKEKLLTKLDKYINSNLKIENDTELIEFVKNNIDIIDSIKFTYCHGDFHPGNLIYMPNKEIGVIDFNRWEITNPYEEFYKLTAFGVESSIPYSVGQINSYFDNNVPMEFWKILKVYTIWSALYSLVWASKFGEEDLGKMKKRSNRMLDEYKRLELDIPKWYSNYKI